MEAADPTPSLATRQPPSGDREQRRGDGRRGVGTRQRMRRRAPSRRASPGRPRAGRPPPPAAGHSARCRPRRWPPLRAPSTPRWCAGDRRSLRERERGWPPARRRRSRRSTLLRGPPRGRSPPAPLRTARGPDTRAGRRGGPRGRAPERRPVAGPGHVQDPKVRSVETVERRLVDGPRPERAAEYEHALRPRLDPERCARPRHDPRWAAPPGAR